MKSYHLLLLASALLFGSCKKDDNTKKKDEVVYDNGPTDSLRINQIQIIASHNSYHLKTDSAVFEFLVRLDSLGALPAEYNPIGIDYWHLPLAEQMSNYGVRGLELDIYNDPQGGHFYNRAGYTFTGRYAESNIDELNEPGFKIIHIPDFDFNTTNYTFKSALQDVRNWSLSHPNHLPIFINIETKEDAVSDVLNISNLVVPIPYDADACNKLDEEIKSVFGDDLDRVITPDDVRGNYSTLEAAALAGNWPKLAEARGKVVFILEGAAENEYKASHPSLQGRAAFVYSNPGTPEAAFVILNNPIGSFNQIQQRVGQGYIVRSRADSNTDEARSGDYTNMTASFNSGAQITSTDYYRPDPRAGDGTWTNFTVRFPGGELARINAISAAGQTNLGVIKE
jgi:hypothetical protein